MSAAGRRLKRRDDWSFPRVSFSSPREVLNGERQRGPVSQLDVEAKRPAPHRTTPRKRGEEGLGAEICPKRFHTRPQATPLMGAVSFSKYFQISLLAELSFFNGLARKTFGNGFLLFVSAAASYGHGKGKHIREDDIRPEIVGPCLHMRLAIPIASNRSFPPFCAIRKYRRAAAAGYMRFPNARSYEKVSRRQFRRDGDRI